MVPNDKSLETFSTVLRILSLLPTEAIQALSMPVGEGNFAATYNAIFKKARWGHQKAGKLLETQRTNTTTNTTTTFFKEGDHKG